MPGPSQEALVTTSISTARGRSVTLCFTLGPRCHYGVAATTRDNLRSHPVEAYAALEGALNSSALSEGIFYMEWVRCS